jgi:hypothetical protein
MKRRAGYALLVLSVIAWAAVAALPFLGIPLERVAAITTALILGGEVAFLAGIACIGKDAWNDLKSRLKRK